MLDKKEITIYDLANDLGLSAATISRALNNNPAISEETRKRVSALAKKAGYQQNSLARNLRQKTSHTIGVIVHELNSHFITSVLNGIEKVTAEHKYNIIIGHSDEKKTKEASNALNLFHKRVDGLIASLAYDTTDLSHYDLFVKKGIPIVFFDRVQKGGFGTKVVIDNEKAGYDATLHLIEQGCKKIIHVTGNLTKNVYSDRAKGYRNALLHHELPFESEQLIVVEFNEDAGIEVAKLILQMKDRPDGIFVSNDLCATICMQRLKDAGIVIPDDIAIVGFNDDVVSRIVEPKLTTVRYNGKEMGEVAARSLMTQLNNGLVADLNYTIILRSELVIRQSSIRRKKE